MEDKAYTELYAREIEGWYYSSRRVILDIILSKFLPKSTNNQILDVGCGTGGTSTYLTKYGYVTGIDYSETAINLANSRKNDFNRQLSSFISLDLNNLESKKTNWKERFDLIIILGVLYHKSIRSPEEVIRTLRSFLKPDGILIWNDATYESLRRHHDRFVHGARRFTPKEMKEICQNAGLSILEDHPILCWGAPIAWIEPKITTWFCSKKNPSNDTPDQMGGSEGSKNDKGLPSIVEALLKWLTVNEWRLLRSISLRPPGVSHLIVCKTNRK